MLEHRDDGAHQLDVLPVGQSSGEGPLVPRAGQPARVVHDAVDRVDGGSGQHVGVAGGDIVLARKGMGREGLPEAAAVGAAGGMPRLARDGDALRPAPVRTGAGEAMPVTVLGRPQILADPGHFVADLHARDSSREPPRGTTGRPAPSPGSSVYRGDVQVVSNEGFPTRSAVAPGSGAGAGAAGLPPPGPPRFGASPSMILNSVDQRNRAGTHPWTRQITKKT